MAFTHTTAMLFWCALSLPPVLVSVSYYLGSPRTETVTHKWLVSLHGVSISALCLAAVLVGGFGNPQQENWPLFGFLCLAAALLVVYAVVRFRGRKLLHGLQLINILWLVFAVVLGRMAVTGTWP